LAHVDVDAGATQVLPEQAAFLPPAVRPGRTEAQACPPSQLLPQLISRQVEDARYGVVGLAGEARHHHHFVARYFEGDVF